MRIYKAIHNLREGLENKLALLLDNINGNEQLDNVESTIITEGIKFFLSKYNIYLSDTSKEQLDAVSKEIVKCLGSLNQKISNQLKK